MRENRHNGLALLSGSLATTQVQKSVMKIPTICMKDKQPTHLFA